MHTHGLYSDSTPTPRIDASVLLLHNTVGQSHHAWQRQLSSHDSSHHCDYFSNQQLLVLDSRDNHGHARRSWHSAGHHVVGCIESS